MSDAYRWVESVRIDHGKLTPIILRDAAISDPDCPFKHRFDISKSEAWDRWTIEVARQVIQEFKVTYKKATKRQQARYVRAYHAVADDSGEGKWAYEPVDVIADDPVKREVLLKQMDRDWRSFKLRYSHLAEFFALIGAESEAA